MQKSRTNIHKEIEKKSHLKNAHERLIRFLDSDSGSAKVTKVVLATIAISGMVMVAVAAPNIFKAVRSFERGQKFSEKQIRSGIKSLKRSGVIEVVKRNNNTFQVRITERGKQRLKEFAFNTLAIEPQKQWDKKWRVVIFDIPNDFNHERRAFRSKLKRLGFYQFQKSAWVYPYPCTDEVLFTAHMFDVDGYIEILTVEHLLHEHELKKFFDL